MEAAELLVSTRRQIKQLEAQIAPLDKQRKKLEAMLQEWMEDGEFPDKSRVNGATIYLKSQVWASPAEGDHERLALVLDDLGLVEYLPKTVNGQSLSAFVREHLDPNELLSLEERLLSDEPKSLPRPLFDALKITDKITVAANGL